MWQASSNIYVLSYSEPSLIDINGATSELANPRLYDKMYLLYYLQVMSVSLQQLVDYFTCSLQILKKYFHHL